MRSILIVAEQFTLGGLETHIQGEIRQFAKHGITAHLACGSLFDDAFLPSSSCTVYSGIPLAASASAGDLLIAINKLRAIIREQEIGAVHVHPFTSIIPAVAAAELEGVPYAVTLHGPASLTSYGPAYDLLFKDIILSNAPLIIAVSPEVRDIILPHAECHAVTYIPNSVSFPEIPPPFEDNDDNDPRWLVVSRLDDFKIQGILDFCIKAHRIGIPGVLIVGDGPAKEDLSQALAIRDLSDFAELAGARIDIPELMRRSSGVAGMGRVVLEGAAARRSTVLVGYDGVKGVVDAQMLKSAARNNFSGRGLPTLDLTCFAKQFHTKTTSEITSENYFIARESFSEDKSWRFFIQLLSGTRSTKPTLITAFYHSLTEIASKENTPYLQSWEIIDHLGTLAGSKTYYDERLLSIISVHRQRLEESRRNQALSVRDGQIASLNQAAAERDRQIASLNQAVVERDHQLAHLRDEAHSLFSGLNQLLHSRSWQLTRPLRAAARLVKHGHPFADSNRAIYDMAARIGRKFPFPLGLKARVRRALLEKIYPNDAPVLLRKDAIDQLPYKASEHIDDSRTFMRPECCGLIGRLVSVVLPVYNQSNLIEESIESVLNQTYQNFELIIINDGSSDGVEAVLERYLDHPKVRCFTQVNQRLPKALSNGFSFARGEFWTWTSADNIMEPRMLELLVGKLRAEPELGMTYADYYAIDDLGNLLHDRNWRAHNRPNPASGEIRLQRTTEMLNIVQDNFIGPCFMYRGWIGRCMGDYDPQLGVEDYDYWMRINAFFPIVHLGDDRLLYRYRVHDNTLSAKAHEHKILEKAQRLMANEKERAAFYGERLAYVADSGGRAWLQAHGIPDAAINSFENDVNVVALAIISSDCAEKNISELLHSVRPVAIIIDRTNTRYHKLSRLFGTGSCIVLACDKVSADRVKILSSTCPVIDANSAITLNSLESFAKNLLFIRSTRTPEELKRELPRPISQSISRHVALQVDSFTQGGMENVVIDLALSLGENGYRVTIANFGKSGDATEKAKERGLKVVSMSDNFTDEAYRSWLIEEGVDLVNSHYSIRGADVCFSAGIPCIQTIHNSYVWLDPVQIEKYRIADQYIAQYICVSVTAARYADVVLGLDASKMRVVPNGIDPDAIDAANFEVNRTSMRGTWGVEDTAPIYLNVASIMATKAQLPLVRAFAKVVENIPQARLVLLGTVMEAQYQSAIEKAVRELGLQKHVIFSGYDRQVSRYYHAADVFVLPSYWEGWSLSLGEAMTNGLSCVITDVGSAYEFEGLDNVGIVEPPFGDIAFLNYKNLGDFVYSEDKAFQNRLTAAMINMTRIRRYPINDIFLGQLDRKNAYQKYSEMFSGIINERN